METKISQTEFKDKLKAIINSNKEGFTIDFNLNPIIKHKGYCIALTNNSNTDINTLISNLLKLKENFKQFKNLLIGGWGDIKTGVYYLDLSIYSKSKNKAFNIAQQFNQKAIFNFSKLNCINIGYYN